MAIFDKRGRLRVMNLLTFRDIHFLLIFKDFLIVSRKLAAPHFLLGRDNFRKIGKRIRKRIRKRIKKKRKEKKREKRKEKRKREKKQKKRIMKRKEKNTKKKM